MHASNPLSVLQAAVCSKNTPEPPIEYPQPVQVSDLSRKFVFLFRHIFCYQAPYEK